MFKESIFPASPVMSAAKPTVMIAASCIALSSIAFAAEPVTAQNPAPAAVVSPTAFGLPNYAELAARVRPAVVSINVVRIGVAEEDDAATEPDSNPREGNPFEKFFNRGPQNGGEQHNRAAPSKQRSVVAGSGFFITADGYAVTNNHVIEDAKKVEVIGFDGKRYPARVIGADPKTDLALIKADGRSDFAFVKLAAAKPRVGEWAMAVGNPFGFGGTVTTGIVSAEGRDIGSGPYDDYIQIDAPINKGNSGGPTFNMQGDVIGVNTAIYSPTGGSVGIAFDVPASLVSNVIPILRDKGRIERGWLGVEIQDVTRDIADSVGLKDERGSLVSNPAADSPAAKAGLRSGDVILTFNGALIKNSHDLARRVADSKPEASVSMTVWRQGKEKRVHLKLANDGSKTVALNSKD